MVTQDIVASTEIVEVDSYESRKGKTWEFLHSSPKDWCMAEIVDFDFIEGIGAVPIYHLGSVKKTPQPDGSIVISYADDSHEYEHVKTPYHCGSETRYCELCGHSIKTLHTLINYTEKKYMIVGSTCISHHHGVVIKKALKTFMDNKTRQEFREFAPGAIEECGKHPEMLDGQVSRTYYGEVRLQYQWWKMRETTKKTVPEKTTSRKLINLMKKFNKMKEDVKKVEAEA